VAQYFDVAKGIDPARLPLLGRLRLISSQGFSITYPDLKTGKE
jgi:hypothetical protein